MKGNASLFLVFLMVISLIQPAFVGGIAFADASHYKWISNGDGTVMITEYNGPGGNIVIPDKLGGSTVTRIGNDDLEEGKGNYVFWDKGLTGVTIPDSVTHIGTGAFQGNNLNRVNIPENMESIGEQAFMQNKLTNVTFPQKVTKIGNAAFYNNKLTNVIFPEGLEVIDGSAFSDNKLTSIMIPKSVASIGPGAFRFNNLTDVTILNSATTLEEDGPVVVFDKNQDNPADLTIKGSDPSTAKDYAVKHGHTFINRDYDWFDNGNGITITGYKGASKDVVIPNTLNGLSVTSIGMDAFSGKQLESVVIPDSVTNIGYRAFDDNFLTKVEIPDNVTSIGDWAFSNNSFTEVEIPNSVTLIGGSAFRNNKLTEVEIPNNFFHIGALAFSNNKLTDVVLPKNVQSIGPSAFQANKLSSVEIQNKEMGIGENAFQNNPNFAIFSYEGSFVEKYANEHKIDFFDLNHPFAFEFHPNSSDDKWVKEASTKVNVRGYKTPDLKYIWSDNSEPPNLSEGWKSFNSGDDITLPNESDNLYLHIYAKDEKGRDGYGRSQLFRVDNSPPVFNLKMKQGANDYEEGTWTNEAVHISIETEDQHSGMNDLTISINNEAVQGINGYHYSHDFNKEGMYKLKMTATDVVGNQSDKEAVIKIDKTAPTITFEPNGKKTPAKEVSTKITVTDVCDGENDCSGINDSSLEYVWTASKDTPDENANWSTFKNGEEIKKDKGNGKWYIHVRAKDNVGNTANGHSSSFYFDNHAPELAVEMTQGENEYREGTWTNEAVKVLMEAKDDNLKTLEAWIGDKEVDDMDGHTHELTFIKDGIYKLTLKATDEAGNETTEKRTVKIDQTKPDGPSIQPDPKDWTNEEKVLVTMEDGEDEENGSGVARTEYRLGENGDWLTYNNSFPITKEGITTIFARTMDKAGNQSEIVHAIVKIDRTPPKLALKGDNPLTIEFGTFYEEQGATAEDDVDGDISGNINIKGEVDTAKLGTYDIRYNVSDRSRNKADEMIRTVKIIDTTPPEIDVTMTHGEDNPTYKHNTWTKETVNVFMEAKDDFMKTLEVWIDGKKVEDVEHFTHELAFTKDGIYRLKVKATDNSGNESIEERIIKIDQTNPGEPSVQLDPEGWTNVEKVRVSIINGADEGNGSGVLLTEYRIGKDGDWVTYEDPFDMTDEGKTTIYVRTIDKAGNVSHVTEAIAKIKRSIPSEPSIQIPTSDWTNAEKVAVAITEESDESWIEYQLNGTDGEWLTYTSSVDIVDEGITTVYARAVDKAGNQSKLAEATVKIDRTAPKFTLLGDNPVNLLYGESYEEPGYEVTDNYTKNLDVMVTGEIDTTEVGTYRLTYRVEDAAGNETTVVRIVNVHDEEQPVVTLKGDNPLTLEVGTVYKEAGANAEDNVDGDISAQIVKTGEVDTTKLGNYKIHYNVSDSSGNKANEVIRIVETVDTTPPEITLNGDREMQLELGKSYNEQGALATDNYDGDLTEKITTMGEVNTEKPGTYEIMYNVHDSSSNISSITRKVKVIDSTAPTDVEFSVAEVTTDGVSLEFAAYDLGGIKEYTLFRDGNEIARIDGDETTFIDKELSSGKTYQYTMIAIDSSGNKSKKVALEVITKTPDTLEFTLGESPISVYAGTLIKIKGTNASVHLPNDLPEGTTLKVESVDLTIEGFEHAGEMFNFIFTYLDDKEEYVGNFVLTLGVDKDAKDVAIYYYNKNERTLEHIGGEVEDRLITATVGHFSTYGVFSKVEEEIEEVVPPKEEKSEEITPPKEDGKDSPLPKTASNFYNWLLLGSLFITFGIIVLKMIRKEKQVE